MGRPPTQKQIKKQIEELSKIIDQAHEKLLKLRDACKHSNVSTKKRGSNTGNYFDWIRYNCQDCGKHWQINVPSEIY